MQISTRLSVIASLLIVSACNTTKKAPTTLDVTSMNLDTINVVASNPVKRENYRASNQRDNDIIDTRLDVSFDWKLCRMNGRAKILVKPYFYPTNVLYLNARGMDITSVEVLDANNGNIAQMDADATTAAMAAAGRMNGSLAFTYKNDSLKINLGRTYTAKENYYVIINYVAKPNELKASGEVML